VSGPLSGKMFTFLEVLLCAFFHSVVLFIAYLHVWVRLCLCVCPSVRACLICCPRKKKNISLDLLLHELGAILRKINLQAILCVNVFHPWNATCSSSLSHARPTDLLNWNASLFHPLDSQPDNCLMDTDLSRSSCVLTAADVFVRVLAS